MDDTTYTVGELARRIGYALEDAFHDLSGKLSLPELAALTAAGQSKAALNRSRMSRSLSTGSLAKTRRT